MYRNFRDAWKLYIKGNVVSLHAVRIIKNFLMACLANGRNVHDDKTEQAAQAGLLPKSGTLTLPDVHRLLERIAHYNVNVSDDNVISKRLTAALAAVRRGTSRTTAGAEGNAQSMSEHVYALEHFASVGNEAEQHSPVFNDRTSDAQIYVTHWKQRSTEFRWSLETAEQQPCAAQWQILDAVHRRRLTAKNSYAPHMKIQLV